MAYIKQKGDSRRYWVKDARCISAECLALGLFQHRGAIGAAVGSRNTGRSIAHVDEKRLPRVSVMCEVFKGARRRGAITATHVLYLLVIALVILWILSRVHSRHVQGVSEYQT